MKRMQVPNALAYLAASINDKEKTIFMKLTPG
jgi:hypothetical protein